MAFSMVIMMFSPCCELRAAALRLGRQLGFKLAAPRDGGPAAKTHRVATQHRLAFRVDEERLRELDGILRTVAPFALYTVWQSDGRISTYTGVEAVVGIENAPEAAVTRIVVHTAGGDHPAGAAAGTPLA